MVPKIFVTVLRVKEGKMRLRNMHGLAYVTHKLIYLYLQK